MADEKDEKIEDTDQIFSESFGLAEKEETKDLKVEDDPKNHTDPPEEIPVKKVESAVVTEQPPPPEDFEQKWKSLNGIVKSKDEEIKTKEETFKAKESEYLAEIERLKKPPEKEENKKIDTPLDVANLLKDLNLSDEEKELMKDYDTDFDVVSKIEGLRRNTAIAKIYTILKEGFEKKLDEVRTEFNTQLEAKLEPANNLIKETAEEREKTVQQTHFSTIEDAHPDYKKYHTDGSIVKWIESKPAYLQKGMLEVVEKGSAEECVQLLDDFKAENNIKPITPNVVNINKAKEERKATMTPPNLKRGAVNPSLTVPTDFDNTWDEAINKQ